MKVIIPTHAGVCYGVERALKLAEEAATGERSVHTLGPLIHNPQAVSALENRGVHVAQTLDDAEDGILVIRSHGVDPAIIEAAEEKGLIVVDATCPHVSKAHKAAAQLAEENYTVLIVGEAEHPEVEGILAHAGNNAIVIDSATAIPKDISKRRVGIVVQTTQSNSLLIEVVNELIPRVPELRVYNTICSATARRQDAASDLAGKVDAMVVVGGRNSGNTTRLVEICKEKCAKTFHVETASELNEADFEGCSVVGVTAGASTPDEQIQGVVALLEAL